ncbi:MAG: histidinol-phosphatase HisJ family protein [Clostridia bacterium]|nr:histidinol-phosphatase HisJ family protein [Clostridia bacterium]
MQFQAHKGVSTENPENTLPAFVAAIDQGYDIIELDVAPTKDLRFVLLHDQTINRTGRKKDGSPIEEEIKIADLTYEEALEYDFGIWFSEKFRGTKIALFDEVLALAKEKGIRLKIDNKYQRYTSEEKEAFFKLLKPYQTVACLTCSTLEAITEAAEAFPDMHLHYDGAVTSESLTALGKLFPKEKLTVWLPHQNPKTTWVKVEFACPRLAEMIKPYASLGVWILSGYGELEDAKALGADLIETNGQIKPPKDQGLRIDMHTHSEHSHDSVCKIADMAKAQMEKGMNGFAVTDHFDTDSYTRYDVVTPIGKAANQVRALNRKPDGKCRILAGVEISEGFWHPEIYKQVRNLTEYDVILGSVHLVQYKDLTLAYSKLDFSAMERRVVEEYVDRYFDDMLTMLETVDFDVLCHLTCPLRYINGKFGLGLDRAKYDEKIDRILQRIIKKGIALEVNVSSYAKLGDFLPDREILERYFQMGGYLVTVGTDSHAPQDAGKHFDLAVQRLKEIGFKNMFYYVNRKPHQISL